MTSWFSTSLQRVCYYSRGLHPLCASHTFSCWTRTNLASFTAAENWVHDQSPSPLRAPLHRRALSPAMSSATLRYHLEFSHHAPPMPPVFYVPAVSPCLCRGAAWCKPDRPAPQYLHGCIVRAGELPLKYVSVLRALRGWRMDCTTYCMRVNAGLLWR
jgi:hypothetical protein